MASVAVDGLKHCYFSLARFSHIRKIIRPRLAENQWVICDRFIDTTRAYQGGGRGVPMCIIEALIKLSCGKLVPDFDLHFEYQTGMH